MDREDLEAGDRPRDVAQDGPDAIDRAALEHLLACAPPGAIITLVRVTLPQMSAHALASAASTEDPMYKWLTVKEVAKQLSVKPATVRAWASEGRFPGYRKLPNGSLRILGADVDAVLRATAPSAGLATPATAQDTSAAARRATPNGPTFDNSKLGGWRAHMAPGHR